LHRSPEHRSIGCELWLGEGQLPEQHEIVDGERRRVGAHAKRGDEDGRERKSPGAIQRGVTQILNQKGPMHRNRVENFVCGTHDGYV